MCQIFFNGSHREAMQAAFLMAGPVVMEGSSVFQNHNAALLRHSLLDDRRGRGGLHAIGRVTYRPGTG